MGWEGKTKVPYETLRRGREVRTQIRMSTRRRIRRLVCFAHGVKKRGRHEADLVNLREKERAKVNGCPIYKEAITRGSGGAVAKEQEGEGGRKEKEEIGESVRRTREGPLVAIDWMGIECKT